MKNIIPLLLILLTTGCSIQPQPNPGIIRIKGSDTMLILNQRLAEEYMKKNPNVSIHVEGGGSATGIQALIHDEIEICAASRPLRPEESQLLAEHYNTIGLSFLIAKDALSIYLNPQNPVANLSVGQLREIFSGRARNWQEVGGDDEPILVATRPPNSGTYLYFKEHILNEGPYAKDATTLNTTRAIVQFVAENRNAIGYGGIAYGPNLVHCKVEGIAPTLDNIRHDSYPITRYLYFYTINTPGGVTKNFIDWILSHEGQKVVSAVGYIPLWE